MDSYIQDIRQQIMAAALVPVHLLFTLAVAPASELHVAGRLSMFLNFAAPIFLDPYLMYREQIIRRRRPRKIQVLAWPAS
jgi:hypothetical protein